MLTYLDTSFLFKLYVVEAESSGAVAAVSRLRGEVAVSLLADVEMAGASHRRFGQVEATRILADYRSDRMADVFQLIEMNDDIYRLAAGLSQQHAAVFGLRSLDALHLATAVQHGAGAIGTFDDRLARAAGAVGLIAIRS